MFDATSIILHAGAYPIRRLLIYLIENFAKIWAFLRNFFSRHHIVAMFTLTWVTIRFAVACVSTLLVRVVSAMNMAKQAANHAATMSNGSGLVGLFDLVNSVFPLWELLVLWSALLALKSVFLVLNAIRYVYKNIPLKAT